MTYPEAVALRLQQLQGKPVAASALQEALRVIAENPQTLSSRQFHYRPQEAGAGGGEGEVMTVYVDDMRAPFGRLVMCHMVADSDEELIAMADRIGVQRKWHQYPGTYKSHFDIALSKRALAVEAGAVQITWRETGMVSRHRRMVFLGKAAPMPILAVLQSVPA